jgi:peptidoglycan hydrolase-like protein with peptidoglycan-binding domain
MEGSSLQHIFLMREQNQSKSKEKDRMTTLTRDAFLAGFRHQELSVESIHTESGRPLRDAGFGAERLARADQNGDGVIKGANELSALFREVDHFDRNGHRASIATTVGGTPTTSGKIVSALRLMFQSHTEEERVFTLTAGVGRGQSNRHADVKAVQQRLKDLGFSLSVDGIFGNQTRGLLKVYESMVRGTQDADAMSGSIRPGSTLYKVLASPDAPKWVPIPRSGTGFQNDDVDGFGYGAEQLVEVLTRVGTQYQEEFRTRQPTASLIHLNDVSQRNGGDNRDHATHESGLDLDIRLPLTNGAAGGTIFGNNYDRDAAFAMIKAFASDPNVERVIQSDPKIVEMATGTTWAHKLRHGGRSHQNHIHIDVKPPTTAFNHS